MIPSRPIRIMLAAFIAVSGIWLGWALFDAEEKKKEQETVVLEPPVPKAPAEPSLAELVKLYGDLPLADVHNHDAGESAYVRMRASWDAHSVDRVVLFGNVSDPGAVQTDEIAWQAYQQDPKRIVPFSTGINLLEASGVEAVRANLEKGYFGIGEVAAASTYSPVLAKVPWKTKHPMDGFLPQIYEVCAEYQAPILLHIDPPSGFAVEALKEAMTKHPDTTFIFAHANAYNSPANLEGLLQAHPNLYIDFFAGFTTSNPESTNKLEDFVPVIRRYPDRFLLSTDSGFGLKEGEITAIKGMYMLLHVLQDQEMAKKIAYDNLDGLLRRQPATATQLDAIRRLDQTSGTKRDLTGLTKLEAGQLLAAKGN